MNIHNINTTSRKALTLALLGFIAIPLLHAAEPLTPPAWVSPLKADLEKMAVELDAKLKPWPVPDRVVRVEEHGAVADGQIVNTAAIQKALDACSAAGGGTVLLSKGDYVTGTIDFRSGVMFRVEKGSRLLGSTNLTDYPDRVARTPTVMDSHMKMNQSLIFAEACDRIGICGEGEIDGRGTKTNFPGKITTAATPGRPFMIRMLECSNITVENITLRNSPCWMQNYLNCENLLVQGITVDNFSNGNNDGIDIDGCRNVIVRNSTFHSEDDGICFKGASMKPTENVLVENCKASGTANRLKFGTDSQGDFRNVLVRNVELDGGSSGISWECTDGGTVENVLVTSAKISNTRSPIFICLTNRGRVRPETPAPGPGKVRRIVFENITSGKNGNRGSIITGMPDHRVEDVYFKNIRLSNAGGGTDTDAAFVIPEKIKNYPDAGTYGKIVPAYGFWIRHASNITFNDCQIALLSPDARPAFFIGDDVINATQDGSVIPATIVTSTNQPAVTLPASPSTSSPSPKNP